MSGTALPITMQLMPTGNSPFICVALTDNTLQIKSSLIMTLNYQRRLSIRKLT